MKQLAVILLLLVLSASINGQEAPLFNSLKNKSGLQPSNSPQSLAYTLTAGLKTDREKVQVIFRWVAKNISYRTRVIANRWGSSSRNKPIRDDNEDTVLKSLNERVAEQVLEQGSAVCDGYTRLFKTLCDYAGVRSEIISGYARAGRNLTFQSNHNWNAVYIDSSWHLLDVTWASGYTNHWTNEFVPFYDDNYFLTPPQQFIQDHYPEDLNWTLLPSPPVLREFNNSPFKYGGFIKSRVRQFAPTQGILEAAIGDTIHFEIEAADRLRNLFVVDTAFIESAVYVPAIIPDSEKRNEELRKLKCSYIVPQNPRDWLYLVFNDQVLLRYKLNVRQGHDALTKR